MEEFLEKAVRDITEHREEVIERLMKLSVADLMFFWGQEKDLIVRQQELWQPLLDWAKQEFDAEFITTNSLDVPEQDKITGYRMRAFLDSLSNKELAAFYIATTNTKSILVAAALIRKRITAEQAMKAAFLEEQFQAETWGDDDEALSRQAEIAAELKAVEEFLK